MASLEQTTKLDGQPAIGACEERAVDPDAEDPGEAVVSGAGIDACAGKSQDL